MIALLQGLLSQALPALFSVNRTCGIQSDFEISAFNSQVEASVFVLDEIKSNLGVHFRYHFSRDLCVGHYLPQGILFVANTQ